MIGFLAAGASLAGAGLDAYASVHKSEGEAKAQEFKAEQAEKRAEAGRLNAIQTDAFLLEELNTTLGNIDVIRAASSIDPSSPTSAAIKGEEARVSDRARNIKVASIRAQAEEDAREAQYRRESADDIRSGGYMSAAGKSLGALGKAIR